MRIIAFLKGRYPLPQAAAIFFPSLIASMAATFGLTLLHLPKPAVTAMERAATRTMKLIAVIDRRTNA